MNTGRYLDDIRPIGVDGDQTIEPDIFVLKVEGGNIYYRDLVVFRGEIIINVQTTATFVPDCLLDSEDDSKR